MSTQLPAGSVPAARRVTGSCRDFTLDRVKFRVVCWGNLEIGLESDTQVGLLAIQPLKSQNDDLRKNINEPWKSPFSPPHPLRNNQDRSS